VQAALEFVTELSRRPEILESKFELRVILPNGPVGASYMVIRNGIAMAL
jgi:hypothetical protein